MSGTRFARSGRCRFLISLIALVLMFGMIAIFHSTQKQLDETKEERIRCEQQQETLNVRLQSIVEQKYNLEKSHENERNDQMVARKSLEQKLKQQDELHAKEKAENRARIDKLQLSLKQLQGEHQLLAEECSKATKQHNNETQELLLKVQSLQTAQQKEKSAEDNNIALWKEKYEAVVHEKERLELILNASHSNLQLKKRVVELEGQLATCTKSGDKTAANQQLIRPQEAAETTQHSAHNLAHVAFDKPRNVKAFSEQSLVSPDLYKISLISTNKTLLPTMTITNQTNNTLNISAAADTSRVGVGHNSNVQNALENVENLQLSLPFAARNNRSLIINSVENFQIAPKPIKKFSEETETQLKQQRHEKSASTLNATVELNATSSSLTSQNQRKLPENVAPIPINFDELVKQQPQLNALNKLNKPATSDNDKNNRYANVVSNLESKSKIGDIANEDSGAHEIKDHDLTNDQNFNLNAEEDNNFFDGGNKQDVAAESVDNHKNDDNEDDMLGADVMGAGRDIAVKSHQLLEAENLNNEVLGDQGKEFPDGIHLEDGQNEEDEDEDDYSNPGARPQGAQAIRN